MPYLILGVAQLAVGAAAIFARYALTGAGPLGVAAGRLGIAAALLLAASTLRRPHRRPSARQARLLACAGVALALHFACWIASLEYTTVAISTLLVTTTPIFTATYDACVRGRTLSPASLGAFAIGGIGLALVLGYDRTPAPLPGYAWFGDALALLGAIAIGAYFLLVREVRAALDTRAIVTRTYTWAALALAAAALLSRQPLPPLDAHAAWAGILAMAVISQLLGHTALNAALHWFSPSAIAFSTLLEPVVAAALEFVAFGEALPWPAIAGGVLVLAAIGVFLNQEKRMTPDALLD